MKQYQWLIWIDGVRQAGFNYFPKSFLLSRLDTLLKDRDEKHTIVISQKPVGVRTDNLYAVITTSGWRQHTEFFANYSPFYSI